MKKPSMSKGLLSWRLNYDLKMKLSLLFFLTISFLMQANSYSQKTMISITKENSTVREVLDEIENISEFKFLFNTKTVDLNRQVTIKFESAPIDRILNNLFGDQNVSYEINDRKILLKKALKPNNSREGSQKDISYQQTLTGTVVDSDGVPLPGANIVEKGTTNGVTADFDGNFSIVVSDENTIFIISYLGYATKEVSPQGQTNINIVLEESAAGLEEVVVVGYGTMKKADLTGSVSQVKSETLESVPVYNMAQALKVGASGVRVSQNSGTPGSRIEVRIRGGNSLIGNNQPSK